MTISDQLFGDLLFDSRDMRKVWADFEPTRQLSDNSKLLEALSKRLIKHLKHGNVSVQLGLDKIQWCLLSLWDSAHAGTPFCLSTVGIKNGANGQDLMWWETFEKLREDRQHSAYFMKYLDELECIRRSTFGDSAPDNRRLDFWDFMHSDRQFAWPLVLRGKGTENDSAVFNIEIDCSNGKDTVGYVPPNGVRNSDPMPPAWWDWQDLAARYGLNTSEKARELFEKLACAYFRHLAKDKSAKYLYEFPMLLGASCMRGNVRFSSVGAVSAASSEKLEFDPWDRLVNLDIGRLYHAIISTAFMGRARQRAISAARAAIMSRNLSHNVGSHVLANPRLYETLRFNQLDSHFFRLPEWVSRAEVPTDPVKEARTHLGTFHQYIQARLDFIARSIHGQSDGRHEREEPMFFFSDVLEGFFRQTVLLDSLLSDCGFSTAAGKRHRSIEFHVSNETSTATGQERSSLVYHRPQRDFSTEGAKEGGADMVRLTQGDLPSDLLVGMPAGSVGTQAFYSFLENVMRNAAKHSGGRNPDRDLQVHLTLRDAEAADCSEHERFYVLEVLDNLSVIPLGVEPDGGELSRASFEGMPIGEGAVVPRPGKDAVQAIREFLRSDAIDARGQAITEGLGVQEMKVAAGFLSGGHKFHPDIHDAVKAHTEGYAVYANALPDADKTDSALPLRCYTVERTFRLAGEDTPPQRSIVYQLLIPKPRLLGIVKSNIVKREVVPEFPSVAFHPGLDSLSEEGAAFGVYLVEDRSNVAALLQHIGKLHNSLPFRLILLVKEDTEGLRKQIEAAELLAIENTDATQFLPVRRVHEVADVDLYHALSQGPVSQPKSIGGGKFAFAGAEHWGAVMLRLYDRWLGVFKKPPDNQKEWRVLFGFQRDPGEVSARWGARLMDFGSRPRRDSGQKGQAEEIRIDVRIGEGESLTPAQARAEFLNGLQPSTPSLPSSYLVFDNHSLAAEQLGIPSLHTLPWDAGPAVYHEFGAKSALALYQSLESPPQEAFSFGYWLYSLIEGSLVNVLILDERAVEAVKEDFSAWMRLRVLPVTQVRLADNHQVVGPPVGSNSGGHLVWKEGDQRIEVRGGHLMRNGQGGAFFDSLDAIIIHEGLIDRFKEAWQKAGIGGLKPEHRLFALAPRVIRTSGRGSLPRTLDSALPFLEASELVNTLYQFKNKPELGKAVCSVTGPPPKAP